MGICGEGCNHIIDTTIASALRAVRLVGIKGVFIYGEDRIIGPASRPAEYHELRRGKPLREQTLRPEQPQWAESIRPLDNEPIIAKRTQNAFVGTQLDSWLRSWYIGHLVDGWLQFQIMFVLLDGWGI